MQQRTENNSDTMNERQMVASPQRGARACTQRAFPKNRSWNAGRVHQVRGGEREGDRDPRRGRGNEDVQYGINTM